MEKSEQSQGGKARADEKREYDRTPGLKLLDVFLYPLLANFSVFAVSVAATYLTARGAQRNAAGKLRYGKIGEAFQTRGEWMVEKFKALGMSAKQADMTKMVSFSFIDGSIMAIPVKLFEDRREKIGRWLDEKMGTTPTDPGAYEAEPKQTWLSLLGGRVVTLGIVIPTAILLGKMGLNDTLFNEPGKKVGAWLAKKPSVMKRLPGVDVKELTRIGFFEAFYTSVCTLGLYLTSRRIASFHHKAPEQEAIAAPPVLTASAAPSAEEAPPEKTHAHENLKRPRLAAEPVPASYAEKYHAEAEHSPAMLGA